MEKSEFEQAVKGLMLVSEAAKTCGVTLRSIYRAVERGDLKSMKIGGLLFVGRTQTRVYFQKRRLLGQGGQRGPGRPQVFESTED